MSVPAGEREEGKFTLPIKAEYLARYTIEITSNENVFLPKYREKVTDIIVAYAIGAYMEIRDANDVTVHQNSQNKNREWMRRRSHQERAIDHCKHLLWMIDLAHRLFHLSGKRVKYWSELVINVRNRTQAWMNHDENRYLSQ